MNKTASEYFEDALSENAKVTPEDTDRMGYKASQLAIDAQIPLTEAVIKVAGEHKSLNNTHLGNICWVANNEYFRKVAAARKAAGQHLVFEFPLADPEEVTKHFNASAKPKVASVTRDRDYLEPHRTTKSDLTNWNPFALTEKQASRNREASRKTAVKYAFDEIAHLREYTDRSLQIAQAQLDKAVSAKTAAVQEFNRLYKQAALNKISMNEVVDLLCHHPTATQNAITHLVKNAAVELAAHDPFVFKEHNKLSNVRVSGMADTTHPLYVAFDDYVQAQQAVVKLSHVVKTAKRDHNAADASYKKIYKQALASPIFRKRS